MPDLGSEAARADIRQAATATTMAVMLDVFVLVKKSLAYFWDYLARTGRPSLDIRDGKLERLLHVGVRRRCLKGPSSLCRCKTLRFRDSYVFYPQTP